MTVKQNSDVQAVVKQNSDVQAVVKQNSDVQNVDVNAMPENATDPNVGALDETHAYVTQESFDSMLTVIAELQETVNDVVGGIQSIRDAQSVLVRAGAVVQDPADPPDAEIDDFVPLSKLDFTMHK